MWVSDNHIKNRQFMISGKNIMENQIKLIYQTGVVDNIDDTSYPFKLYASFAPPEFMEFAFICLYGGSEEIIVRGKTRTALTDFIIQNRLISNPRLRKMEINNVSLI